MGSVCNQMDGMALWIDDLGHAAFIFAELTKKWEKHQASPIFILYLLKLLLIDLQDLCQNLHFENIFARAFVHLSY